MSIDQAKEGPPPQGSDVVGVEFAEFRHKLFNSLAVMMAMAEMARVDSTKFPRLAEVVLEKGADLKESMLVLSKNFRRHFPGSGGA